MIAIHWRGTATKVASLTILLIAVIATAMTTTSASVPRGSMVMRADDGCAPLELIEVPGTTEGTANPSTPTGLLAPVANDLQHRFGSKLRTFTVPYPAVAFTNGLAYADSKRQGVDLTRRELDRLSGQCPATKVALIGYSQGADVAGDVACEVGSGDGATAASNLVAVGLVSDPHHGTAGATDIGPVNAKQGIMGPRTQCPAGFGSLKGRVASICINGDLYCGVDRKRDPLLAGIAAVVGNVSTGANTPDSSSSSSPAPESPDSQQLAKSLTSDFSQADLGGLPGDLSQLVNAAHSGDGATVARLSGKISDTLAPLADIVTTATGNPGIANALKAGPAGSPQAVSSAVLNTIQHVDLGKAASAASQLANTALAASGTGARVPTTDGGTSTTPQSPSMSDSATALSQQIAPLANTPAAQLSTAAQVFSTIKPTVWVDQITNIASGTLSMAANLPQILQTLGRIGPILLNPGTDIWAKIHQLHDVADQLNLLFEPVVKMAAAVDLHTAASLIGMIPDPQGIAPIISTVVGLLANVDVIGVANEIGNIQTTSWKVLESCQTGCNLALATPLIGSGLHLVTLALGALGGGDKTPPDQLGKQQPDTASDSPLSEAASKLTAAGNNSGQALSKLMQQGLDAASFYAGGSHQSYGGYVVDRSGRTTIQYLTDWISQQFTKALGV